jgi:hypothetical protein
LRCFGAAWFGLFLINEGGKMTTILQMSVKRRMSDRPAV